MGAKLGLSETEYMIMSYIWEQNREFLLRDIQKHFTELGYTWAIQTVKTFINNLIRKGALTYRRQGHQLVYYQTMDRIAYSTEWMKKTIEQNFSSGMNDFVSAFGGLKNELTEEQKEELRKLLYE